MQKPPIDEHLMTDYLLGALSETDTESLDKLSLSDGEFADRLLVAEDDLVDAYARGELSGDLLNKFTSHFLASARNREKVRVAEHLLLFADKTATASTVDKALSRASPSRDQTSLREPARPSFFAMPRLALQWGFAAAALVFLMAGGYLAYENLRLRREMTQTQTERAALEQHEQELRRQLAAQRSADAEYEQELTQVRERLAQLEQQQADQNRDPKVVAFNLAPQTRSTGQMAAISVPAETDTVAFKLDVEATGFPRYQLALKDSASGKIIWRRGLLRATGATLRVSVPAGLLKSQNYLLELSGISAAGEPANVGNYPFRVTKR